MYETVEQLAAKIYNPAIHKSYEDAIFEATEQLEYEHLMNDVVSYGAYQRKFYDEDGNVLD